MRLEQYVVLIFSSESVQCTWCDGRVGAVRLEQYGKLTLPLKHIVRGGLGMKGALVLCRLKVANIRISIE